MIPAYRRGLRQLRRLVIIALSLWALIAAFAWLFPVSVPGATVPTTISPTDTTRNFITIAPVVLRTLLPLAIGIFLSIGVFIFQFAAIFWYLSRGRTYTLLPGEYDVNFSDVRGQPEIVASTKQVMSLFQGYRDFQDRFGGYPPRGILFEGPPGTGKTLLAKAIAGESGVPFIYASGASFANMFVGVGNMRVARMFTRARKYAERWGGCVIFLDELDSIGGARGGVADYSEVSPPRSGISRFVAPGGGGIDASLVNELLTQLDGIDAAPRWARFWRRTLRRPPVKGRSHNILIVGATNRARTLDRALLRPGRFDRKIHVGLPHEEGRRDIISYYLAKVAHVPIDIDRLAKTTAGYSPARIRMLINEALIFARRAGRDALSYDDIWQAKLHDEVGLVEPVQYNDTEKRITAIHEAGHAVARILVDPTSVVEIITIRKRGGALGLVYSQPEDERFTTQKSEYLAHIQVSLAGLVAEEIWFGQSSSGPSSDLRAATHQAILMVGQYGMGDGLASHALLDYPGQLTDSSISLSLRDPALRAEVDQILQDCKAAVRELLEKNREAVEVTRDALLDRLEITGDEFRALLYQRGLIPKPKDAPMPLTILPPNGAMHIGERAGH